ncbi:MAG: DNA-binding protein WhiA [Coriobacteriales bacterium]|jgi:DNA-binding protein WhiA|nr:DNA-binding protein WhiA [Coriobacteriales bacterium]
MSFCAEIKDELARIVPEHKTCRVAELAAISRIDGHVVGGMSLEISVENAAVARIIIRLLHELYSLKTSITTQRPFANRATNYTIIVPAQANSKAAISDLGLDDKAHIDEGARLEITHAQCCKASYLRGAFLACGFVSDPRSKAHFELACDDDTLARTLIALMAECGIKAHSATWHHNWVVYLKDADQITDFFALTGAHKAVLAIENTRVTKSIRNEENRLVNAEIANQVKSAKASIEQVRQMRLLLERVGSDGLPPALVGIINLRLEHPDVSLRELGRLASPPLSKSAVYHRIRRIEEMAAHYDEEE